jgi:hypothetical protein
VCLSWCFQDIIIIIIYHISEKVLHRVKKARNILHTIERRKADWIGHIHGRNCLYNTILKERQREGTGRREDEEEDVSNYWMILREREDTGN